MLGWPIKVGEELQPFHQCRDELTTEQGCILWGRRVIMPTKLRDQVLKKVHEDHPGVVRMKAIARSYFWWPSYKRRV